MGAGVVKKKRRPKVKIKPIKGEARRYRLTVDKYPAAFVEQGEDDLFRVVTPFFTTPVKASESIDGIKTQLNVNLAAVVDNKGWPDNSPPKRQRGKRAGGA